MAGSSSGNVVVYDAKQARVVAEYIQFHKAAIYRVAWCPISKGSAKPGLGAGLAASCSADGFW